MIRKFKIGDVVTGNTFAAEEVTGKIEKVGGGYYSLDSGQQIRADAPAPRLAGGSPPAVKKWASESAVKKYAVEGVLAGRYRGKDVAERPMITHAVLEGASKSLCGRVRAEDLAGWDEGGKPSCSTCLARVAKL